MNKNDIKLVIVLLFFVLAFFVFRSFNTDGGKVANVYYEDKIIETISLDIDGKYSVIGDNGEVIIEVKNNKIRVLEENSENNLCSKQGYSDVIVCLPNKIVIKVESRENELDGVVK